MPRLRYGLPSGIWRFLLALLLCAPSLAAQTDTTGAEVITFREALERALDVSPDLRQARLAEAARGLSVTGLRADRLPSVSALVQPTQRYGLTFDQRTGQLGSQTSEALNVGLTADWTLFDGFRTRRALEQARLARAAGTFTTARTQQQVVFEVAQRFLDVVLNGELVRIQQSALEEQRRQRSRVEAFIEAGVRPRVDLISQQAVVAERELAVVEAEGQRELAETRLIEILQLDPLGDYAFFGPEVDPDALMAEAAVAADLPLDTLLATALARRADLRAQALQVQAAQAGVGVARTARLPRVAVFGEVGTGYSSLAQRAAGAPVFFPVTTASGEPILVDGEPFFIPGTTDLERTPFFTQFADNRSGAVGLSINVPIFDRYAVRRQEQQARIEAGTEQIALERLQLQATTEVRQAVLDLRNAAKRLEVTAVQVAAAEAALRAEQDRYEFGAGTLDAVATAQGRLAEARSARAQAAYEFVFRQKLVQFAAGALDMETALEDLE